MNVSGVSWNPAASGVSATTMSGASRVGGWGSEQRMQAALGAAAQLFGMSSQQLQASVAGGESMAGIAASKGISADALSASLQSAISAAMPQGASASSALVARIAGRIANHSGPIQFRGSSPATTSWPAAAASTGLDTLA